MTEDVEQVVMTHTQQELLNEVRTQYERNQQQQRQAGLDPALAVGKFHLFLPYALLREAFAGEPPVKGEE